MQELNERVAIVETKIDTILSGVTEIKAYLGKSAEQRVTMLEKLAVIGNKQDDFVNYQVKCDDDRGKLGERVGKIETFQKNQKKVLGGIAALVSLIVYGGGELIRGSGKLLDKLGVLFS